ncbi:hypothetical protein [Streptomyces sp. NPDC051997]|uniref:hypothetical protein n=1 Tax=Streptomyces sp. NPDC051997 TaxID=3155611 RepID=UPI00341C55FD
MSESGQTWQRAFKALPAEATGVRTWIGTRTNHPDAPAIANELFVALLHSGTATVEMAVSTAGTRTRITASGHHPLRTLHSHGPGRRIINGLAQSTGLTVDECGLWAQIQEPGQ